MADSAPVLLWRSGTDALCDFFNRPWLEFRGRTMEEEVGNGWFEDGVHPDDKAFCWNTYSEAFEAHEEFEMEYRLRRHDSEYRWVLDRGAPRYAPDGEFAGYIGSCIDVTERHRTEEELRESERRFKATFEQAAIGIAHVAPDGSWIRVNDKLCEITSYQREELLEKTFQDITHPDDLDADLEQARQLLAGEIDTYSMEKRYLRKDGSVVWINLTVSLVRGSSGEAAYFIAAIEDISGRKRAEEAMRNVREAERRRMARDLHDGVLQDLSYTTAAMSLIMLEVEGTSLEEELQRAVDALRRSGQALRAAVNDLRLEGEANRPFPELVASLVERSRAMNPEHGIRLEVQEGIPSEPLGDAGVELARVLQEALTNTRRHSNAANVRVRLWTEDRYLLAEVADNGRGLGPEYEPGGGSKSMRERALQLGGTLEVRSTPGEGTRVRIRVPMDEAMRRAIREDTGVSRESDKRNEDY